MYKLRSLSLLSLTTAVCSIALSGCGMTGDISSPTAPVVRGSSASTGFGGMVHGGQQPVTGSTVQLWAAGVPTSGGGYGTGASLVSATASDAYGNFSFDTVSISGYSVPSTASTSSGTLTFTTSGNRFAAGDTVTLSGFGNSAYLDSQSVTVLSAGLSSTSFEAVVSNIPASDIPASGNETITEAGSGLDPSASPCTTGQYLYMTATGGNAGAGNNSYIALMAPVGVCGPSTGSAYVVINEVSTVATVWALQQFMTINQGATSPTPIWNIGTPSTNIKGFANAFQGIQQLENQGTGLAGPTTTPVLSSLVVNGATVNYSMAIATDTKRIYTLANILSSCVNQGTASSTQNCSSLFSDTTLTNSSSATGLVPADTIQVAYNLATNPAGIGVVNGLVANMPTGTYTPAALSTGTAATGGSPYHLCATYVIPNRSVPAWSCLHSRHQHYGRCSCRLADRGLLVADCPRGKWDCNLPD